MTGLCKTIKGEHVPCPQQSTYFDFNGLQSDAPAMDKYGRSACGITAMINKVWVINETSVNIINTPKEYEQISIREHVIHVK